MGYWIAASLVAWGLLSLVGLYWHPLRPEGASTILIAMGIGCVANWHRNRTLHCGVTAPLFLVAGILFLLSDAQAIHIQPRFVWPVVTVGTVGAFLLEWRLARRSNILDRNGHEPGQ